MVKVLEFILKKFPDHRTTLINLYNKDEDFRTLCDDFYASAQGLDEKRSKTLNDRQVENEYSKVFVELEKEIIRVLKNQKI